MSIERRISIDDTYMHVIEFGRGDRDLVMLVGSSLCGIEGAGDAIETAYGCMCDDFHVYCVDTKRAMPPTRTIADMAADAARCLDLLGVKFADFMGVSHGGMIAMTLAAERPELVRRLALCGTSPHVVGEPAKTVEKWKMLARAHDVPALGRAFFNDLYSKKFRDTHEELQKVFESHGTEADCDRFVTVMDSILTFDIRDRLHEIKCPTIVLCATDDRVLGADASRAIASAIGCELHVYDGFGHAFYDETDDAPKRLKSFFLAG